MSKRLNADAYHAVARTRGCAGVSSPRRDDVRGEVEQSEDAKCFPTHASRAANRPRTVCVITSRIGVMLA